MELDHYLILVKGEDKTEQIQEYQYKNGKFEITFQGGKTYTYLESNVLIYTNPSELDLDKYAIFSQNQMLTSIEKTYCFEKHIRVIYKWGKKEVIPTNNVQIVRSCLSDTKSRNTFEYLKQIASVVSLKSDDGNNILATQYNQIDFIRDDSILAAFLDPSKVVTIPESNVDELPLFPFGFNHSQKEAVHHALCQKVSMIEGPPGTGKTQTILNIIANIVRHGRTVAVVSGNNSATLNILEKLKTYELDFLVASLGSSSNKTAFIQNQPLLPDMTSWQITHDEQQRMAEQLSQLGKELDLLLLKKNKLSQLRTEKMELETEIHYFEDYFKETYDSKYRIKRRNTLRSHTFLRLWNEYQLARERNLFLQLWMECKHFFHYGLFNLNVYRLPWEHRIALFQQHYYMHKRRELHSEISELEQALVAFNFDVEIQKYAELSMKLFKSLLVEKYNNKDERHVYSLEDLKKNTRSFLEDYPVILSTTYSLRSSLSPTTTYDYLIIDEASQVDVVTGALAFSCASRAIIVGDRMQLPNVVSQETANATNVIFHSFEIPESYQFATNSLLSSVVKVFTHAPRTLLREHYRCHPKIIAFCNQKFYENQLIVQTESNPKDKPLTLYKTVKGNHSRGKVNQREIDVIFDELIPKEKLDIAADSIGIITPYNKQIEALQSRIQGTAIEVATVHKYQGREKDRIILSTVDNQITEFTDSPNLLNVAVSRAVKQLFVVTSGNKDTRNTNINDLVNYIEYNNFEIINSQLYSVFDYLYKEYTEQRKELLKRMKKKISVYDSENIMYELLIKITADPEYRKLKVVSHIPLKMMIRDFSKLNEEEVRYTSNLMTHVDFLIYDRISHAPVLVIEVDGVTFHREGSRQKERDNRKDTILQKYSIPYIRLRTDGSNEEVKIRSALESWNSHLH
ncbi:AAA domain-containing protein [Brevibacillus centrosporus]|uniref:AAA domain-containing protein n=1 Tax=Brevibacillus centrosporus TaxID=54910 RepID=UPI003B020E07